MEKTKKEKKGFKFYLNLFWATFSLSAFTVGGGYVIVPLMRKKFVEDLGWIDEPEMLDLVALSQSAPGAMAVNCSILVGYRVAGILGALVTTFGTVLPPLIIISIIQIFYEAFRDNLYVNLVLRSMNAGVAAVIADVVISMSWNIFKSKKVLSILIMFAAFIIAYVLDVNVVYVILGAAVIGCVTTLIGMRKVKKSLDQKSGTGKDGEQ